MRMRAIAVGLVAALAVAGCGGGGAPVEGNVVIGGKAYNPETDGDLSIVLGSDGGKGSASGQVLPNGTFKITSNSGGGLPNGPYKVSITRYPTKAEIARLKGPPTPLNKETGETWDVGGGKKFTLDMSKVK